jgi:hypothetical protein
MYLGRATCPGLQQPRRGNIFTLVRIGGKERIRTGYLPRHLAWQALTTTILPKLHYPLAATTMTEKECNFIMSPVLQGGLPCSGIVRTLPHTLVYGTTKYQGLRIPSLYTEQGIAHIFILLQHGHQPPLTGNLLRASLQALQVELGVVGFPLEQKISPVVFLATDCWVKHAWKFMLSSGFTIQPSASDPSLTLRQDNDSFLMESVLSSNFGSDVLRRLSRCRLFLKVTTPSDITMGDGNKITTSAWQGAQDNTQPSHYEWPAQSIPPAADWEIWRSALQSTVCSNSRILRSPVGAWTDTKLLDHWMWYFSPSLERLYQQQPHVAPGTWSFYPRAPGRPSRDALMSFIYETSTNSNDVPHNIYPATIDSQGTRYSLTGYTTAPIRHGQETASFVLRFSKRLTHSTHRLNGLFKISRVLTTVRQLREQSKTLQPWQLAKDSTKTHMARRLWSLKVLARLDVYAQIMLFPAA